MAFVILLLPGLVLSTECTPVAQLVSMEGSVDIKITPAPDWQPATLDQEFCVGDSLRTTTNSRAAVRMINDTLLRLDSGSVVSFTHVEKKQRSILDLINGAVHFISRTPRSLQINTPFVNAGIEGTEFVMRMTENATDVTVYEGLVVASNSAGSINLASNETGRAESGQAPVRIAVARPRDAVAWALYYPPLPEQPGAADTLAQQTIEAIVQNQVEEAAAFAQQAIAANPQSAAAFMAQSYVDQARFDIPAALSNSQKAVKLAPQNALTQARLAEVWLMTGDTRSAQLTAAQAVAIDPGLSLTQSILGFSSLREVNLDAARATFEKAISLDSAAPLPRLGLGLVKIRRGDLKAGREDIETAALLDPNNALLRSYMGKAYYEEKRNGLASEQFNMAKDLDQNDPTAWLYDSIMLQSENRPVEALLAQQKAIELNDNRGVYRSRQLLDQDEAAKNIQLGRIYTDLSYEQLTIQTATKSISYEPENYSAHRLLSDAYAGLPRHEIARTSELLQAQLLQPGIFYAIPPQLSETSINGLRDIGLNDLSYQEYSSLFAQNKTGARIGGLIGENNTQGNETILSSVNERFTLGIGQYHYETDGFRENNDLDYDLFGLFGLVKLTPTTKLQAEYKFLEYDHGDLESRFNDISFDGERKNTERQSGRIGLTVQPDANSTFLAHVTYADTKDIYTDDETVIQDQGSGFILTEKHQSRNIFDTNGFNIEAQSILNGSKRDLVAGLSYTSQQVDQETNSLDSFTLNACPPDEFLPPEFIPCVPGVPLENISTSSISDENEFLSAYMYTYWNPTPNLKTTIAASFDKYDDGFIKREDLNPKLGAIIDVSPSTTLRAAYFRSTVRPQILRQTIEPTNMSGFNQFFYDFNGTRTNNYGLGIDHQISRTMFTGIDYLNRDLDFSTINLQDDSTTVADQDEKNLRAYLYFSLTSMISISSEYFYEKIDRDTNLVNIETKTETLPLEFTINHPSGWYAKIRPAHIKQKIISNNQSTGKDSFAITDLETGYYFLKRKGLIRLGIKNVFDDEVNLSETLSSNTGEPQYSAYYPESTSYIQLTLNF